MQKDLSLISELTSATLRFATSSDVIRFEFLCGFSHWLLCQLEESLKNAADERLLAQFASTGLACSLSVRIVRYFPQLRADGWEFAGCASDDVASRTVAFALQRAASDVKNPEHPWESPRRWAQGQSDDALRAHAAFKTEYVLMLMVVTLNELPQLLSFSHDDNPNEYALAKATALTLCDQSLAGLAAIARFSGSGEAELESLWKFIPGAPGSAV